eukprot:1154288-Pleurochrysis_carterae.AAC.1
MVGWLAWVDVHAKQQDVRGGSDKTYPDMKLPRVKLKYLRLGQLIKACSKPVVGCSPPQLCVTLRNTCST